MQAIYTGHGHDVEWYDIEKGTWTSLPKAWMYHFRPSMWLDQYNRNLLFMSSFYESNGLEYVDLRECNKWNIVKIKGLEANPLSNMFGINSNVDYTYSTCFLNPHFSS